MKIRPSSQQSEAFTLIEVLLSLAIAGVIITLAYSLFHTANATVRGQQERNQVDRSVFEAFLHLERDLMNAVPFQGYPEREFRITEARDNRVELEFAAMQRIPGERDAKWANLMLYRYVVDDTGSLIRESRFHIGDAEVQREVVLQQCGVFLVSPSADSPDGDGEPTEHEGTLPGGIQLTLAHAQDITRPLKTRILIPAGQTLTRKANIDSPDPDPALLHGLP